MIGETISHYRIIEKLGQGGMGEVFPAHDTSLDRKVALKFLPDIFSGDPERLARFQREAKLLASLNHPNIATIYGLEQEDGKRFLAMELVEGEMLGRNAPTGGTRSRAAHGRGIAVPSPKGSAVIASLAAGFAVQIGVNFL
jgi:eukaryotic-like serine/threonine-protein kinase